MQPCYYKAMLRILLIIAVFYGLAVLLLFVFQRKVMYIPSKAIEAPERYGLRDVHSLTVPSSDGIQLQLWYIKAKTNFPTVLYFHGNAGHIGDRAAIFHALSEQGFGVLALSYRGYGGSSGEPSESGIYDDARAAIGFLQTQHISLKQIMLFGESLGTGVATQMATEFDVGALILQAPYLSVAGRAAEIYYYVPVKWLIHDKFESIHKITKVKAPLLLFHGERDTVIPIRHGRELFAAATSPKRAFFMPNVAHNDFDSSVISAHVLDFAKEHQLVK